MLKNFLRRIFGQQEVPVKEEPTIDLVVAIIEEPPVVAEVVPPPVETENDRHNREREERLKAEEARR